MSEILIIARQRTTPSTNAGVPHHPCTPASILSKIEREFPTIEIELAGRDDDVTVDLDLRAWSRDDFDFWAFDRRMDARCAGGFALVTRGEIDEIEREFPGMLTRCQRLILRKNAHSSTPRFDTLMDLHRRLHRLEKQLVRSDYDHALDVWQWMLRLNPDASLAAQAAALLHDIERLTSEADRRVEQHAVDYQAFKHEHSAAGAGMGAGLMESAGFDARTIDRARTLIEKHEHRAEDPELDLLNDADALSFFSLNSPGYFDYFGTEQGRRKVAYTIARLGMENYWRLRKIRLRADVRLAIDECLESRSTRRREADHYQRSRYDN